MAWDRYSDLLKKAGSSGDIYRSRRVYLVGGSVRDLLLGREPKDVDLVCSGARDLASLIAGRTDAALVPMEKLPDEPCYRIVRRDMPSVFIDVAEMRGATIEEDLACRDFTINAVAVEMKSEGPAGNYIDPFNGIADMKDRSIRMVHESSMISDPLRILRAFRFAAELDFNIEDGTIHSIQLHAGLISKVSAERITAELFALLRTAAGSSCFRQMDSLGLLDVILPEIIPMKGCKQNGYHHLDVWQHSLLVTENTEKILNDLSVFGVSEAELSALLGPEKTALLKLAALLHDAGKPETKGLNPENGRITFYGHDRAGAEIAGLVAGRLKFSNKAAVFIARMIGGHLRPLALASPKATVAARMRWFRNMMDDSVPAIILSAADVMSSLGPESGAGYREHFAAWASECIRDYFSPYRQKLKEPLLINGDDLIGMGMLPGPAIGRVLYRLRTEQDLGMISDREQALARAKAMMGGKYAD